MTLKRFSIYTRGLRFSAVLDGGDPKVELAILWARRS
jgi:hypothetical protein